MKRWEPNLNWEPNPNWEDLPEPEVEDIVHLRFTSAFRYTAKVIVTAVGDDKVTGHIEALFDTDTSAWVEAGDKNKCVGKEASFGPHLMHEVIKRDAHQPLAPDIECR